MILDEDAAAVQQSQVLHAKPLKPPPAPHDHPWLTC